MNYYSDVTTYRFYNKRHQLVQRASVVVICFTLFRNVRPCTILGYTLTNIPQKFNTDKNNKKRTSTKLRAVTEEGPCIKLVEKSGQQVFYTGQKQLNKIRKEEIRNPQNNRKRTTLSFVYFSLFISKVKPSAS